MALNVPDHKPSSAARNDRGKKSRLNDTTSPANKRADIKSAQGNITDENQKETFWDKYWPPVGWSMFETITNSKAIATKKDPETLIVCGASFQVSIHKQDQSSIFYTLEIQEWSYDQVGQHTVRTPLLLRLRNCPHNVESNKHDSLCFESLRLFGDIKHPQNHSETNNFALVAAYLASRIEKGIVPDIKRVLKLYNLL
jgi:hypothetical protein